MQEPNRRGFWSVLRSDYPQAIAVSPQARSRRGPAPPLRAGLAPRASGLGQFWRTTGWHGHPPMGRLLKVPLAWTKAGRLTRRREGVVDGGESTALRPHGLAGTPALARPGRKGVLGGRSQRKKRALSAHHICLEESRLIECLEMDHQHDGSKGILRGLSRSDSRYQLRHSDLLPGISFLTT